MRGRVVIPPIVEPVAVIKRAAGRLDDDCPSVTVAAAMIKTKDKVQNRNAERAERSATVSGNRRLLIWGNVLSRLKRAGP